MMTPATRIATGFRAALVAVLAFGALTACSSDEDRSAKDEEPCATPANGVIVSSSPPKPDSPTSQNLSTNPEVATGYRKGMVPVDTQTYAVSTANPVSTVAACAVLRDGGTAGDALIVAQTVLGLVEPQATGIGGGAFLLYYDAANKTVEAYDGRETAPKAATENYLRWISDADHTEPRPTVRASGRSIGVPGVLRMLELAHNEHGKTPWRDLFGPAIALADSGVTISPRFAEQIAASAADLAVDDDARAYFLNSDNSPKPVQTKITNPAMAKTLNAIATDGANAFYTGAIAEAIVDASASTAGGRTPGQLTLDDLAGYQAKKRTALCTTYRNHEICGMPSPSSGGTAVAATLGILENFDLGALGPSAIDKDGGIPNAKAVHLVTEAERLAYADRDKYVADTDFVPLPGNSTDTLLNKEYLKQRAGLINPEHSMGTAKAGDFGPAGSVPDREHGTSHISIADKYGNVASMTTTVESAFGSFHMVDGFILNNQLTDFSATPTGPDGAVLANRVEPGKRPRSSMSPTLVFDRGADGTRGNFALVTGSPGGSVIIQFVVETVVGVLDWGLNPQQAVSAISFGAANSPMTGIGGEHPSVNVTDDGALDPLVMALRGMGHQVSVAPRSSGLSALLRKDGGWIGGADPRREGVVTGDRWTP